MAISWVVYIVYSVYIYIYDIQCTLYLVSSPQNDTNVSSLEGWAHDDKEDNDDAHDAGDDVADHDDHNGKNWL